MQHVFHVIKPKKLWSEACMLVVVLLVTIFPPCPIPNHCHLLAHMNKGKVPLPLLWLLWTGAFPLLKWLFSVRPLKLFQHCSFHSSPHPLDTHPALLQMLTWQNPEVPKMSSGKTGRLRHKRDLKEVIKLRECCCEEHTNWGHLFLMKSVRLLVFQMWELLSLFCS